VAAPAPSEPSVTFVSYTVRVQARSLPDFKSAPTGAVVDANSTFEVVEQKHVPGKKSAAHCTRCTLYSLYTVLAAHCISYYNPQVLYCTLYSLHIVYRLQAVDLTGGTRCIFG
jgi:hypothetical protein